MYWSETDNCYIAEVPELPRCMSDGKTPTEAIQNTQEVIGIWLETAKEDGWDILELTFNLAIVSM